MAHIIGTVSLSKSVYSLRDIAKYENIGSEKIESLMSAVLKAAVMSSDNKSASGIQAFYNNYGKNDININRFLSHGKLRPFAYAIKLETEKCYQGKKEVYFAMFCVSKNVYNDWRRRKKPYDNTVNPNMSEYGLPRSYDTRSFKLNKCPELTHFENTVKSLGFKMAEAVMLALNEYMERHKDVFGEIPHSEIDEYKVRENRTSMIYAHIDPAVTSAVFKAIQRYNMINVPHVKFSEFVEAALTEKLDKLPVKYTDPELYKEQLAIEKAEAEYMQRLEKG
jgi:hypothetical protein